MRAPLTLRLAKIEDIKWLCALEIEFDKYYESHDFDSQYGRVNSNKIPENFYRKSFQESIDDTNCRIFIAEVNGNIVGSSTVVKEIKMQENE
jgi:hypothetical protein